ncbi:MAG: ketopantoate reductase family protein [Rhizobiaceae bacterium]
MRVCIFGAGAVGGHLAARLAASGQDPLVIGRGAHLQAMKQDGLTLKIGDAEISHPVRCSDDPFSEDAQDVIITTLKGPALPGAAKALAHLCHPDTVIVYALNGIPWWYFFGLDDRKLPILDPGQVLWDQVGVERTIGCVVYSANEIVKPGVVLNRSAQRNRFVLGEPNGTKTQRVASISAALERAGLEAPVTPRIRTEIWRKFITGNLTLSTLAAMTQSSVDFLLARPDMRELARSVAAEGMALAKALGVDLEDYDFAASLDPNNVPKGNRPSMLQDLELGRPMEIDSFIVVIQEMARMTGTPMPSFDIVAALLKTRAAAAGLWNTH